MLSSVQFDSTNKHSFIPSVIQSFSHPDFPENVNLLALRRNISVICEVTYLKAARNKLWTLWHVALSTMKTSVFFVVNYCVSSVRNSCLYLSCCKVLCPLYTASFEISSRTRMASTEVVLKVYGISQNKTHVLLFIHLNPQRKNLTAWADQVCLLGLQHTQRIPASKVSHNVSSAD
jgi:hypothetical protein